MSRTGQRASAKPEVQPLLVRLVICLDLVLAIPGEKHVTLTVSRGNNKVAIKPIITA